VLFGSGRVAESLAAEVDRFDAHRVMTFASQREAPVADAITKLVHVAVRHHDVSQGDPGSRTGNSDHDIFAAKRAVAQRISSTDDAATVSKRIAGRYAAALRSHELPSTSRYPRISAVLCFGAIYFSYFAQCACPSLIYLRFLTLIAPLALNGALTAVRAARLDGHLEHPNSSPVGTALVELSL
jgi:hypothetical protein